MRGSVSERSLDASPGDRLHPHWAARSCFRLPAEWEPHAATWLAWPHNRETWPGVFPAIADVYVEMVAVLHHHERVCLCVNDADTARYVRGRLTAAGVDVASVSIFEVPTDDAWIRDFGPLFVTRPSAAGSDQERPGRLCLTNWTFNAWGGKYPPWNLDDAVPRRLADRLGLPVVTPGIVLEGGAIDVNGRGMALTTEACLLNPNRNPHLSRTAIEQALRDYLGIRHVGWLGAGIAGDDTDGHVDEVARFVNPTTVVCAVEDDPDDPNYASLQDNLHRLHAMRDQDGRPLRIVRLPMPAAVEHDGQRLPASYANFYVANAVVLVPTFGQAADQTALAVLRRVFPGRRVCGIPSADLVVGLGGVHCLTMQQPAGAREETDVAPT